MAELHTPISTLMTLIRIVSYAKKSILRIVPKGSRLGKSSKLTILSHLNTSSVKSEQRSANKSRKNGKHSRRPKSKLKKISGSKSMISL